MQCRDTAPSDIDPTFQVQAFGAGRLLPPFWRRNSHGFRSRHCTTTRHVQVEFCTELRLERNGYCGLTFVILTNCGMMKFRFLCIARIARLQQQAPIALALSAAMNFASGWNMLMMTTSLLRERLYAWLFHAMISANRILFLIRDMYARCGVGFHDSVSTLVC